jgi:alkylation response protein AidB-like acyl-CoA dehydrogenase
VAITNPYKFNDKDSKFLLWKQFKLHEILEYYPHIDQVTVNELFDTAQRFAINEIGPTYQASDREGCRLNSDTEITIPKSISTLWTDYQNLGWGKMASTDGESSGLPFLVIHSICEMFFGANPAFMMYSGFGIPMAYLLEESGSERLNTLFHKKLIETQWCGSFCVTEPDAGSDVGALNTSAKLIDGEEYSITGEKIFITAGMHQLTNNMIYLVVARIDGAPKGVTGLSCFLVPKYKVNESGEIVGDNYVRCSRLEKKMGLHGCATTGLTFGVNGETTGYLLGKPNRALWQLKTLMNLARLSTGIFALGMASSAYQNSVEYSKQRKQGSFSGKSLVSNADRVNIIEHLDVKRMLLEMKSTVEGCRALIFKLSYHLSVKELHAKELVKLDRKDLFKHKGFVELLTPIVKSYASDQAWRVSELAIQVHGGSGYISDNPLEQYARDIKILSIWEGTNYIQSADLIRDKLAMGRNSKLLNLLDQSINELLISPLRNLEAEFRALEEALRVVKYTHEQIGVWVEAGNMDLVFSISTRFLEMMAELIIGWLLLEGAKIAFDELQETECEFLEGKIITMKYFFNNTLPGVLHKSNVILSQDDSTRTMMPEMFCN